MNSQACGELTSDQKIANDFRAYDYSIPVENDGRRLWPRIVVSFQLPTLEARDTDQGV